MKRCINCGWGENPDTNTHCEKCNSPLDGAGTERYLNREIGGTQQAEAVNLNQTIREVGYPNSPYTNNQDANPVRKTQRKVEDDQPMVLNSDECPVCGYPLRKGSTVCPQCHTKFIRNNNEEKAGYDSMNKPEQPENIHHVKGNNEFKKTVPPSQFKRGKIQLTAINAYDIADFIPLTLSFTEEEILLNRSNVEADNPTISRKEHALLTQEGGKWFLENKSPGLATSLVLTKKHELQPGDIVIIGDRIFKVTI